MIPITLPAYTQAASTVTVTTMKNYLQSGSIKGTRLTPRLTKQNKASKVVYFKRGAWLLTAVQKTQLTALPSSLCYAVKGYASTLGSKAWNEVLSGRRADAVTTLMRAKRYHILHSRGYGELRGRAYAKAQKVTVEGAPCQN